MKGALRPSVGCCLSVIGLGGMEGGSSRRSGKFTLIERQYRIDTARLRIVAFAQDETTRKVLQTASLAIKAPSAAPATKGH